MRRWLPSPWRWLRVVGALAFALAALFLFLVVIAVLRGAR
jgi:tellurite resistance protein TehA-like permease